MKRIERNKDESLLLQNIILFTIFTIGSIGLYSWFVGDFILVSVVKSYVAMAQSTSFVFCIISILLFLYLNFNNQKLVNLVIKIFSIVVIIYCALIIYRYYYWLPIKLQNFYIAEPKLNSKVLHGLMSPVTAALFIFAGINIILFYIKDKLSKLLSDIINLILLIVSFIMLIGYLYQSPLLYASKTIPVALPTATCFLLLSISFIIIKGLPFNMEGNKTIKYQLSKSFIPLIIIIIVLQGYIETNILHRQEDPTLYVALVVFISIIISVVLIIRSSFTVDKKLKESVSLLKASELKYKELFEANTDGITIFCINEDGSISNITDANENSAKMIGFTKEEILQCNPNDLEKDITPEKIEKRKYDIMTKGFSSFDTILLHKDGHEINVEIKVMMINYNNKPALMNIVRDLTERKQAEDELTTQKNFFEQMFMQSSVSTQILDKEGWCERINPKLGELFGVEPQHIEGKVYNIFKDEGIKQGGVIQYLERVFYEGKTAEWEVHFDIGLAADSQDIIVKEKKKEWFYNWAYPIFDEESKVKHVIIQHNDITERKQVEYELIEAKERAEESDRLKSAFLANMSHEIRTPMNGIMGFAELLKEPQLTGEDQLRYIDVIQKSGIRMLNIINDIISISKIEAGLMDVSISDTNFNEQLDYIYTFFKPETDTKGIKLSYNKFLLNNNALINTDKEKVYSILTNLVKNAIKYTDEGYINFGYTIKDNFIEFYIKDSGIGVPIDRQKAIFERFIQADIEDKRALQGAGLGLAITKAYVEMLGGEIWIESKEGKGSVFYFTIPYIKAKEEPAIENDIYQEGNEIENSNLKILIVEDDQISDILISKMLEKISDKLIHVKTGLEAVETFKNNPDIDMILMDINLPVMDGFEAVRQIRAFDKNVIIIAQTAYALIGDREKAIEMGCNNYISKPIDQKILKNLILSYFSRF